MIYEDLIDDPRGTVLGVLAFLGLVAPPEWRPRSEHVRQADDVNEDWVRCYARDRP